MKELFRKNIKFISIMMIVIVLGIVGSAYAVRIGAFNSISVNTKAATIAAHITYDNNSNSEITSTGKMLPIEDSLVTYNSTDERIVKSKFYVSGDSTNPNNTIYDISLRNINMSCDLRNEDIKWKLFKGSTEISSGNFSPSFDAMSDQRLVLTTNQNDLTTANDEYTFMMWISESCSGDIGECNLENDQSKYLNKNITANLKVETSTGRKKALVRKTASNESCTYTKISIPTCNNLTYNGRSQTLINEGGNYTLYNNTGIDAGNYVVTAKLAGGYKWTDNTTEDKTINCKIKKRTASVIANDQTVSKNNPLVNDKSMVTTSNIIYDESLNLVFLSADKNDKLIIPSAAIIKNSNDKDTTNNYNINYVSGNLLKKQKAIVDSDIADIITYGENYTYDYMTSDDLEINSCSTSDASIADCILHHSGPGTFTIIPNGIGDVSVILTTKENDIYDVSSTRYKITVVCSKNAAEPTVVNSVYDGNIKNGLTGGENITLGGTKSSTNSGNYIATATPLNGYCWSDGNNDTKSYIWKIDKANASCNVTSIPTFAYPSITTGTIKYSCIGDGNISVTSSKTNIIEVGGTPSNTSANLTAKAVGNSNITIAMSEGNNYKSGSTSRTITVANGQYTITYDANGGGNAPDSQIKTNGTTLTLTNDIPTWEGHTFKKWNTKANGTGTDYQPGGSYTANASVTLYAVWATNTYTVLFDPNGGELSGGTLVDLLSYDSEDMSTWEYIGNPVFSEGQFDAGFTHITGTVSKIYKKLPLESNVSYKLEFGDDSAPMYNVYVAAGSFDSGNHLCDITVTNMDMFNCSFTTLSSSNDYYLVFDFNNQNMDADIGYFSLKNSSTNENVKVTVNEKSVNYNGTYGDLPSPTRNGYTFDGWYTDATLGSKITSSSMVTTTSNHTLYAHWTPNTYKIILDNQSATSAGTTQVWYQYNTTKTIDGVKCYYYTNSSLTSCLSSGYNIEKPTKNGYTFGGYYTSTNGGGTNYVSSGGTFTNNIYKKIPSEINSSYTNTITLYAKWTINSVTIKYNMNGGSWGGSSNTHFSVDSSGYILYDNSVYTERLNYGQSYGTDGLANYDNASYINILKTGYHADSGKEWKRTSDGKTYSQASVYSASDFCDLTSSSCSIVLNVNWTENILIVRMHPNGATKDINGNSVSDPFETYNLKYSGTVGNNWPVDYAPPWGYQLVRTGYEPTSVYHVGSASSSTTIDQDLAKGTTNVTSIANSLGVLNSLKTSNVTLNLYAGWKACTIYYDYKVIDGPLNCRKTASTSGTYVTQFAQGATFCVSSTSGDWAYAKDYGCYSAIKQGSSTFLQKTTTQCYNSCSNTTAPAHTHSWTQRGNTVLTLDQYYTVGGVSTNKAYGIYCSVCHMSAWYYKFGLNNGSGPSTLESSTNPDLTSVFDDSSLGMTFAKYKTYKGNN